MSGICVLIPAHNEVSCIAATLDSIARQTLQPEMVVVVDDFSADGTGDFVRKHYPDVVVIRPESNLGSKAKAQNYGLFYKNDGEYMIQSAMVVTIDADTSLDKDALERLSQPLRNDPQIKAACGTVIPANLDNPYTLGRLAEYLYAFAFPKRVQQACGGKIQIVSGCFGCYATKALRERGGWHTTTMAEDMDLTADYHQLGYRVAYVHEAICRPIEPFNWHTYSAQMERWSAAFFQNVALHRHTYSTHWVGLFVLVSFLDALIGGIIYPLAPLWMYLFGVEKWIKWFLIGDLALVSIPILYMALKLGLTSKALLGIPCMYYLRYLNIWFWFRALIMEWILKRRLDVYIKGH